jgi:hypothetical protein
MVERLLFYRINGQSTGLGIDLADERAVMVTPTTADARFAIGYMAVVRAE